MHLWEVKHTYYCSECNYYDNGSPTYWKSWHEFEEEFKDSDLDYNMFFRFDWVEGEDHDLPEYNGDLNYRNGLLKMFMMGQRKGMYHCHMIEVCRADEQKVIKFLKPRWDYMKKLWSPIAE